jgi:hypothetical protein
LARFLEVLYPVDLRVQFLAVCRCFLLPERQVFQARGLASPLIQTARKYDGISPLGGSMFKTFVKRD